MSDAIELRPATFGDLDEIARVTAAEEIAWWGEPDGTVDDVRDELERVVRATGSLEDGSRLAVADDAVVGVGMLVGHGHTTVALDPDSKFGGRAHHALIEWLDEQGGEQFDSPAQDTDRLQRIASHGFTPRRSSFELERSSDVADLPAPTWPDSIVPVPFRLGVDDGELHDMIYSFWTEVPGHTFRPIDEWRALILAGSWFEPDQIILARGDGGDGPVVGGAITRTFAGKVGWVSQLGVAHQARGLGLGRALLLEACHRLAGYNVDIVGLGVEAENANALGLYRSVGMEIAREWVHCERQ
jgi:mycothiol synthase